MNYINIATIAITLFAVIDMLGNIPLIIKLREDNGGHINSFRGTLISTIIMIVFLFFGKTIFNLLGVDAHHFGVAGALLICWFGLQMVIDVGSSPNKQTKKQANNATVFPIAFPLIAGPGTLSVIISMRAEYNDLEIVTGILINSVIIFLVLKSADWLKRKLGVVGINLIERIFGIIIIAIGIKMFLYNVILSIEEVNQAIHAI